MYNIHLPDALYERLPMLYLALAVVVALAAAAPLKWLAIGGLIAAAFLVSRQRRTHRQAEQMRRNLTLIEERRQQIVI